MNSGNKYKCLSIRQPLAWAVCVGEKTVENRSKNTTYRGLLLIHAGKKNDGLQGVQELPNWKQNKDYFPLGAIVGAVQLHDAVEFNRSLEANPHANGPFCYLLGDPKWFPEPIPCTGQLGFFGLPAELEARVESQLAKPGRAIPNPKELLEAVRPSPSDACCHQGSHYLEQELFEDALRRFDDAINLDKDNAFAYYLRSLAQDSLERPEKAMQDISEAIKLEDGNAYFVFRRGWFYEQMEKPEDAIRDYSQAIKLDGGNPAFLLQRGLCHRTLGRLQESTSDFEKVIELDPDLDSGYFFRGINRHLLKDYSSALSDFNKVLEINPDDMEAKLLTGAILLESGQSAEGLEALKAAREQFLEEPWPCYFLYSAHKRANRHGPATNALDDFKKNGGDEQEMRAYLDGLGFSL